MMSAPTFPCWRLLPRLCCLALLSLLAACQTPHESVYGNKPGPKGFSTVVLDAGHGGKDSGARARGQMEKSLTLDIAQRVKKELAGDFRVVMIRDGDQFVDLDDRVRKANRYDGGVLVSIHFNYGPRRLAGPETYWWRVDSSSLGRRLHKNLLAACSVESGNRGLVRRRLRLTRNPEIPCVLVECGYLTNAREAALLKTPEYRAKLAKAIANALKDQKRHGDAGMGPLPAPIIAPPSKGSDARDSF
ncbi:N-acetylmuramoyl-L-alanine amidase [Verrucomicrobium sp. BvORR034]|jgi:N-acetylmuramoyl-L-alanine amidase|uniref:N-acetylmuramoyl-L-alanine amidase family protein n=1 Tax=Verrucomicrobium sp. BvORR034 TaxID=1396418 RepID=UPI0009DE8BC8|nr:N-acetylmuramoyl-L-alanine amidase [Verrucomicrobium sp. BvORR034]